MENIYLKCIFFFKYYVLKYATALWRFRFICFILNTKQIYSCLLIFKMTIISGLSIFKIFIFVS